MSLIGNRNNRLHYKMTQKYSIIRISTVIAALAMTYLSF